MGKILFYASTAIVLGLAGWIYARDGTWPSSLNPLAAFLFAVMMSGYGLKASDEGAMRVGNRKIHRDRSPTAFRVAVYLSYLAAAVLGASAVYLLAT